MRNLLALASDPGPSFTRHVLAYGLSGAPPDLRQSLVQRRDGSYTLFLWRDDKIWDPKARKRLPVSSESVTLKLPDAATVQMFRPSESAAAVRTWTGTSTLTINLDSDLVALTLRR